MTCSCNENCMNIISKVSCNSNSIFEPARHEPFSLLYHSNVDLIRLFP